MTNFKICDSVIIYTTEKDGSGSESDATTGNTKKIFKNRARLNVSRYTFPNRVVDNYNGLLEWVINANNKELF